MGGHGVARLVDGVHAGVDRRVKADGVVRVGQVVVDGSRQADDVDAALALHQVRPAVGAVAAADHQALDAVRAQVLVTFLADGGIGGEFRQAGRAQHRAAAVDDVADIARQELLDLVLHQAQVPVADAEDLHVKVQRRAHHRADGRVHAGRVAAGGQNRDLLLVCHILFLSFSSRFSIFSS